MKRFIFIFIWGYFFSFGKIFIIDLLKDYKQGFRCNYIFRPVENETLRRIRAVFFPLLEYVVKGNKIQPVMTQENINFPFLAFSVDHHQGVYLWLKEKIEKKEIDSGLGIINLDYHDDYDATQDSTLSDANWLLWARAENLIGKIYWIRPEWSEPNPVPDPSEIEDPFELRAKDINNLPSGDKLGPVILTIDFDFFSLERVSVSSKNRDKTQHRPTAQELDRIIDRITQAVRDKRIVVKALNFTYSADYVWQEDIPIIKEKLIKAFQTIR
jgi:hypothetical protein